ncbi:MAG: VCBS repeat-containing protein [Pirellulaceae bacterium]|nr:VCBS repeat-containing protein [Pirellulaceae bacterium]
MNSHPRKFITKLNTGWMLGVLFLFVLPPNGWGQVWQRHVIDDTLRGADGVRLADFDGDGLQDVVTGWEESGVVRLYLHPGYNAAKSAWPSVTVGKGRSPEDAVAFDVDRDGRLDVVSCHEGKQKQVLVHRFVGDQTSAASLLMPSNWKTESVESLNGQMWMFATALKLNDGSDALAIGSKGANATITLLRQPMQSADDLKTWTHSRLRKAGWIMSLQVIDMDHDGDDDIVFSDRKGKHHAVAWLEQPDQTALNRAWPEHIVGATDHEPMFIDASPDRILVSTRDSVWIDFLRNGDHWESVEHPNPADAPFGKAIHRLGDRRLVMTANTAADKIKTPRPGIWMKVQGKDWRAIGSTPSTKFDRMEITDIDGDGDLDVMTCEEKANLGVVWFENPGR